ncbi:tripartite tricarboxylate transporter substrate binding protein [Xylophilus sp. GOD-11R]|uniref:Bug family tripartite tricarboxylate transporter substrate binding protein n=1 Tax=Xylophilus sp. GOD-11R TaxID=3089814 RepID=UPI00298C23B2|nr:tripartite tricarboxylate transporter substrate binding protein [Xylophilus sp. GOD-11R]WPB55873.1 tripartite tricarboxylate transporter substrate binding protein [Xylophilus sp. GOD-11R]
MRQRRFAFTNAANIAASAATAMALACLVPLGSAQAQDYPSKPIRLVIPFAAGGPTDTLGRGFAQQLSQVLKQQVYVDNKGGAGGGIGVDIVAKAPPDGYTIALGTNGPLAGNTALFKSIPYDPVKDLAPVARVAFVPNVIAVHPSIPAKTLAELIEFLKANPDKYSFASGGNGTTSHLGGEALKLATHTRMTHVPYKGDGPALVDAIGGQVPIIIASVTATAPYVQAGNLRALAVTSRTRSPNLPDVPTVEQAANLPGYEFAAWYGVVAPAATPPAIVKRLADATLQVIGSQHMADKLLSIGGQGAPMGSAEFGAFIKTEVPRWSRIIKQVGATAD